MVKSIEIPLRLVCDDESLDVNTNVCELPAPVEGETELAAGVPPVTVQLPTTINPELTKGSAA